MSSSNVIIFFFGITVCVWSGFSLLGGSGFQVFDNFTNNVGSLTLDFTITFRCTLPNKLFNFFGNSITFNSGITIDGSDSSSSQQGCTVSSANALTTSSISSLTKNNTFNANSINFLSSSIFSVSGDSINNRLTFIGGKNFPTDLIINSVEFVLSGASTVQDVSGTGIFSPNGGLTVNGNGQISTTLSLPSGDFTIGVGSSFADLTGNLFLHNTNLGGNTIINFYGVFISLVKGIKHKVT